MTLNHRSGFVFKVTGAFGKINKDGNIPRQTKFGYQYLNDNSRILKPLKKAEDGGFEEISFEEAFKIIKEKIASSLPDQNAFFAGARLSNEEQYLIQKIARNGVKTDNIGSFQYLGRSGGYQFNSRENVPFEQIKNASRIYVFGADIAEEHGLVSFFVNNAKAVKNIPSELVTVSGNMSEHKAERVLKIKSYYWFVKGVNACLAQKELQNQFYINGRTVGFGAYINSLSSYAVYADKAGVGGEIIADFAERYNKEMNAVLIFSEKHISGNASSELFNLAAITGKLGKTASGLISLKESCNSHGLFDNRCFGNDLYKAVIDQTIKNIFIFGEDPAGCAVNREKTEKLFAGTEFVCVQDNFMTMTAMKADLILPASFHTETEGSFTNTQRVLQNFKPCFDPETEKTNIAQLIEILGKLGIKQSGKMEDIFLEASAHLPKYPEKHEFTITENDNHRRMFHFGCDYLVKRVEEEFEAEYL
jgi:predicted molibdopterin-dependent oxidoreductase YjgC